MKTIAKFLLAAGIITSLSSLALAAPVFKLVKVPNSSPNTPTAINNAGQVVVNSGSSVSFAVSLWTRLQGVESLGLSGENLVGVAIDAAGDIAGAGNPANSNNLEAFLWQPASGAQWLGALGGPLSAATGMNASGDVVGFAYTAAELQHAFLWTNSAGMQDLTPNLSSPGGATAMGINSSEEVVGYYYPNGGTNVVGFSWTEAGGLQNLGAAGTLAMAINDAGTIVGRETTASGYNHAFSWTEAGGMVDLGTLGGDSSTALAINNKGWILGTSLTNDGKGLLHGFLWTPSGGMQDFTTLSGLGKGEQPYSMQANDFGDIAVTTSQGLFILAPIMSATATSSANPSVVGEPVTVTATLSSIAGPPPDGETVEFTINGNVVGTGTTSDGVAQCTITGLTKGSHVVAVVYGGDAYYLPFRDTPLTQVVVNPASSSAIIHAASEIRGVHFPL